jgi:hypothetical protein
MKAIRLLAACLFLISIGARAQSVTFSTDKTSYRVHDTIFLKIVNKEPKDYIYEVALEMKITDKWVEIESDIVHQVIKVEHYNGIRALESVLQKVVLPKYVSEDVLKNKASIRFRLKYGLTVDKIQKTYSDAITLLN